MRVRFNQPKNLEAVRLGRSLAGGGMRVGRSRGFVQFRPRSYWASYILCPVEGVVLCAKLFNVEHASDALSSQMGRETGAVANFSEDVPARQVFAACKCP